MCACGTCIGETLRIVCDGPEEFRKTAREMVREGVDTLKINRRATSSCAQPGTPDGMTEAEIEAVCEVGRMHDKRVAATRAAPSR